MADVTKSSTDEIVFADKQLACKIRSCLLKACAVQAAARVEAERLRPATTAWAGPSLPFLYQG
jgi:hypothetical protein